MNQKEFKAVSDFLSPHVAKKLKSLEDTIDNHFINNKKIKKSDYKASKEILFQVIIESIPDLMAKYMQKITDYSVASCKHKLEKLKKK